MPNIVDIDGALSSNARVPPSDTHSHRMFGQWPNMLNLSTQMLCLPTHFGFPVWLHSTNYQNSPVFEELAL